MKISVCPFVLVIISVCISGCAIPGSSTGTDGYTNIHVRCNEGLAKYDELILEDPGNASAWLVKALYLNDCGGRFEEALACCDTALEIDPDHAEAWFVKGVVLKNLQRYDEADDAFQTAARINPEFSRYMPERN